MNNKKLKNYFSFHPEKKEIFLYDLKHNHHFTQKDPIKHQFKFDNDFVGEMRVINYSLFVYYY